MKKAVYAACLAALSLSLFFVWIASRRFERRVVPRIAGNVVDSRGKPIEITKPEISVLNEVIGSVDVDILGAGEFSVAPRTAMLQSGIGYRLTDTLVSVRPTGYKEASCEVSLTNEEHVIEHPGIEFRITFRLQRKSEEGESSNETLRVDRYLGIVTPY